MARAAPTATMRRSHPSTDEGAPHIRNARLITAAVVALATVATLALARPAAAAAAKYCINSPTCVTSGGIGLGSDANALANALANAQNSLGKDTVVVGPARTRASAGSRTCRPCPTTRSS
jgi:hypothetical protein